MTESYVQNLSEKETQMTNMKRYSTSLVIKKCQFIAQ